jgi:hypothetical protein
VTARRGRQRFQANPRAVLLNKVATIAAAGEFRRAR